MKDLIVWRQAVLVCDLPAASRIWVARHTLEDKCAGAAQQRTIAQARVASEPACNQRVSCKLSTNNLMFGVKLYFATTCQQRPASG